MKARVLWGHGHGSGAGSQGRPTRAAILLLAACLLVLAGTADDAGARRHTVRFLRNATGPFDPYITDTSTRAARWMRNHYAEMRGYAPYFTNNVFAKWTPPRTSFYKDLYGIYNPSQRALINQHPDWVLRDEDGTPLYIPWACAGGTCPHYAADFGNQGWRNHWIAEAAQTFAAADAASPVNPGYRGIFIDDVNLDFRISDGNGNDVRPIDPRTGEPMTLVNWRRYMVEFLEQIRAAFPNAQITHNAIWWLPHGAMVRRQVRAADVIELERGFNDPGLTPGKGRFGHRRFLRHISWLHRKGRSIVLEPYLDNKRRARYELANYFLIRDGDDAIASDYRANPRAGGPGGRWWGGWNANLGRARGRAHRWHGLWRRNFRKGIALVNPRGGRAKSLKVSASAIAKAGASKAGPRSVRLAPGEGRLLRKR